MILRRCPACERLYDPGERFCSSDGRPLEAFTSEDPLVGRVLEDRFRVQAAIGSGGMGVVYRAEQLFVERAVALKLLRRDRYRDELSVERFLREARAVSRLASPHTVRVLDVGRTAEGELFLVMELLTGRTLRQRLEGAGPIPPEEAASIADQVACSLSEAHAGGLVHRDLKPDNVFLARTVDYPAFVKVLDFGIAVSCDGEGARLTQSSEIPGTPAYLAPERISGEEVDARADVYALGVLLYEMLSGQPPFGARGAEPWDVLMAHVNAEPEPFDPVLAVPPALEALVWRCLAKSPRLRPPDAGAFRQALRAAVGEASGEPQGIAASTAGARRPARGGAPGRVRAVWVTAAALLVSGTFAIGRITAPTPAPLPAVVVEVPVATPVVVAAPPTRVDAPARMVPDPPAAMVAVELPPDPREPPPGAPEPPEAEVVERPRQRPPRTERPAERPAERGGARPGDRKRIELLLD